MSGAVQFTIPALSVGIEVVVFERWLESAGAGDRIEYAAGPVEPRSLPIWKRVNQAVDEREVAPLRSRRVGGGWQWLAERTAQRREGTLPCPSDAPDAPELRLLKLLRRCANFDQVCPTNGEAAALLGLKNADAVRYLIGKLIEQRLIAVLDNGPNERRIVTILANGRATVPGRL